VRSWLGHYVVWYMVMNVWRSNVGLSLQAVRRWRQHILTETSVPTSWTTGFHNPEDFNFES
jgi:hypothetical protein